MSSWGNNDNAANAPYWAVNSTIVKNNPSGATPDSANVAKLYANTTANVYIQDTTIGLFGVDAQESLVTHASHSGWVLKTTGQGGRAGRVQNEVLVALSTMNSDGDGQIYANVSITLSNPSNASVTAGAANANSVTFTVTPTLVGNTAAALTYQWQVNSGVGAWVNMSNGNNAQPVGVQKSGVTTNTVTITPWNTTANNYVFRAIVTAADQGVTATTANAYITIY